MEINLSEETINVIVNSLRNSKQDLKSQIKKWERTNEPKKVDICKSQLSDVEYTLSIFEEHGF